RQLCNSDQSMEITQMRRIGKVILVVVVTLSLQLGSFASIAIQDSKSSQPKTQAPAGDKSADKKPTDYSQEAFIIEQVDSLYKYESDGTGQRETHMRVKIQSEAGVQEFGQLVFPYSSANEKIEIDYVTVHKKDGTTVNATETNVQDLTPPVFRM